MPDLLVNGDDGGESVLFAFAGDELVALPDMGASWVLAPLRLADKGRTAFKSCPIMAGPYSSQSHVAIECPVCHYPSEVDWEKVELEVPRAHVA